MPAHIDLIAGLGNPGVEYEKTRHNAGFWLLDSLARRSGVEFRPARRFFGDAARLPLDEGSCLLLKPATFMNRSGRAVAAAARYHRLPVERILIVHDDIDLPPGVARIKRGGGHGGHNGLRDIITALGGEAGFWRLRLGVGRPATGGEVEAYVLRPPPAEERARILAAIDEAIAVLPLLLTGQAEKAMNRLHARRTVQD